MLLTCLCQFSLDASIHYTHGFGAGQQNIDTYTFPDPPIRWHQAHWMMCDDKTHSSPYTKSFKHFYTSLNSYWSQKNFLTVKTGWELSWVVTVEMESDEVQCNYTCKRCPWCSSLLGGLQFEFWLKPSPTGKCCSLSWQNGNVCVVSKTFLLERKSLALQWRATWELLIKQRCFSPPNKDARVNLLQFCLHKTYYMGCNFTGWRLWTPRSLVNRSLPSLSSLCF